ncbi:LysM peptidoglycan-binding domain-containing protein [Hyunsoonleella pacifica]|uniref:LysM peptidoglycan-binding domain-containing protein n=1 Tax=Hyunsoonleella pacifica TaxID=1080224 RepID=A0A4Q9FSG7_9FLAO|nr:LysM peptidoglycan-binding domain-containing protein [Hyunsoonleella pacifica]TBN19034.1 LysM peptidoglycan-binding domain-containing protein [Hyunsoonleella pacifica]
MLKSFRHIFFILFFISSALMYAQSKPVYKDVLLNGKPAKLNVETGEFIQVNGNTIDTIKPVQVDSKTVKHKEVIGSSDSNVKKPVVKDALVKIKDKPTPTFHIVKAGETLFGVSKKYDVSLIDLKKANNLETTLISVGQKLRIANFDQIDTLAIWIVEKGNTLYSIAKKNNTTVKELKQLNNLKSNTIIIGQKLRLK